MEHVKGKILILYDDPQAIRELLSSLTNDGHECAVAYGSNKAYELLSQAEFDS